MPFKALTERVRRLRGPSQRGLSRTGVVWLPHYREIASATPVPRLMLIAAIIVGVTETILGWRIIGQRGLLDPDNYMRLVRIRDGLKTGWFTHIVAADNGGAGTVVYWSHVIDAVVLVLRLPFSLVTDHQTALLYGAAATGPIVAALLAAVLIWTVAPLERARWLWTAPLIALFSPHILVYGTFGYVHHHLPLALMSVLSAGCAGRAIAGRIAPGFWCGICAATGIWISPEALPYVLMAMGAIGVAWSLRPAAMAGPLAVCGLAFAAATTTAVLIDPPFGGRLSPEIDCVSIVYAILSVLVCGAACFLAILGPHARSTGIRALSLILTGAVVIGIWLSLYPGLTHGLEALSSDPRGAAYFDAIAEMQPLRFNVLGARMLTTGILGVIVAAVVAGQTRSLLWSYAALCGLVVLGLAISHARFALYAEAGGALMVPVAIGLASASRLSPVRQSALQLAVLMAFLLGPKLPALVAGGGEQQIGSMANCRVSEVAPLLSREKNAIVLTEISDTPAILWLSPVRTVGSLYHRSMGAFLRARDVWRSAPSNVTPPAVRATGATHILACDLNGRSALVSDLPPTTLQDKLAEHDVPPWLHEVGRAGGYRLYAVDRETP